MFLLLECNFVANYQLKLVEQLKRKLRRDRIDGL